VGLMSKNQVWNFTVRPKDGAGFGGLKWVAVTVSNSPPTFTSVYISPDPAMSTDTLKAIGVGWFDADGDAAGYLYQWQKRQADGSWLNIAGQIAQTLSPSNFKSNDTVRVNCTAFDGQNTGTSLMETKWIANFSLPLANPLLVSSLGTNTTAEDLICYNVTGTQLTNIYNWNLNGSPWASLLMPFDTNSASTAKDYSGNGNNGTVSGAAWTNQGVVGGAYSFSTDGETSGDVITVQDSATLGGDGTWTQISIEFWIKASSSQSGTRVLAKKIGNQPAGSYGSYTVEFRSGNALRFGVVLSPTSDLNATGTSYRVGSTAATTLVVGDWYHVVCTYKSGVGLAIYLNGTLRVSGSATGYIHPIGVEPLFIGFDGGTDLTRYFNGTLDELRIYPTAISAAQVLQRYMETSDKAVKTETIVSEQLQAGQQWSCQVTPNTGSADGTAKFSNTVTIVAAPVMTQYKLTVNSGHDTPNPTVGDHYYNNGSSVTCSVTSPVTEGGTVWTCTGWTGTGSVPASGSGLSVTFSITQNSTITWNWQQAPVVNYIHVWGYPGGLLDPAGSIKTGEAVRIFAGVSDLETASNLLNVTIRYKAQIDLAWTVVSAQWEPLYGGYWYHDWTIPGGASLGLYDVRVEASDGNGGSVSATEYGEFAVANANPVINYIHVWGYPGGLLDPAGSIKRGESVRIFSGVVDAETPSNQLNVTIRYKAQADSVWTIVSAQWESNYGGYWYYDWTIPGNASLGLYDVQVEASDGNGGSASVTEYGEFTVNNMNPVVNYIHVWGYPGGLLDPAGTIKRGETVRIFASITDLETASNQLNVTIKYKAQTDPEWTTTIAQWEPLYGGYWYYDWVIPANASSGLYDVRVEVYDGNGGFASATEYGEFNVTNANPVVNYIHVWGYPGGLLDPAGTINTGEMVRIFTGVMDLETASDQLNVTISYKAQSDVVWTTVSAQWEPLYGGYWYHDWTIPGGASLGLYDVRVEASDGNGGSVSATEYGEFTVIA